MISGFKSWISINENFGDDHDYKSMTPHHIYKTKDNHLVHVHMMNNPKGQHAVFFNKNLGLVTKIVHWNHGAKQPSKQELEHAGEEDFHLTEAHEKMSADTAGKIAEHATAIYLHGHKHEQAGTFGSDAHKKDIKEHESAIKELSKGNDPKEVEVRKEHGRAAANAVVEAVKMKHGPDAKIVNVGHTSKPGDIPKFTKGKHNDTQENPSDVAVEVKNSSNSDDKKESHFEGYSLKSSGKSNRITAKNPAIHVDKMLDHPTRKLETEKASREGIVKHVLKKMGAHGKSAADRSRELDAKRKEEGVKNMSSLETQANEHGRAAKTDVAKEFHDHLHHLTTKTGNEGHQLIGKMLDKHLTAGTSMPWSKVHVKGDKESNVRATLTHGSESPLRKVFADKKTKYSVSRSGDRVTIHRVEKDGSHTPLAHYSPKTKSNVFKSDVHGWNVMPAAAH